MPAVKANGINIYYETRGDGEPLLLISGTGTDHMLWIEQVTDFSREYRLIVFDNRGVGLSDKPETPYTVRLMAEDAIGLMDALGIEKAHIHGLSLGSVITQEIAISHPERVITAGLHATWDKPYEHLVRQLEVRRRLAMKGDRELMVLNSMCWLFSPVFVNTMPDKLSAIEAVMKKRLATQPLIPVIRQYEADILHDSSTRLSYIKSPTLVTVGEHDAVTLPEYSRTVSEKIAGSEFIMFEKTGHLENIERAKEFNSAVLDFLRGHPAL